jgi:hypothetical protein
VANDEFSKTANKALEHTAAGAAAAVGTVVAGPFGALTGAVVVRTGVDWFQRRANKNDDSLYEARLSAMEDEFGKLDERVRKLEARRAAEGGKLDRDDLLSREAVYSEFAKGVTEAATPEKRLALVNAAARQFDPIAGLPSVREYWFKRVRALPDLELQVVRILHEHNAIAFNGAIFAVHPAPRGPGRGEHIAGFIRSEVVAIEVTVLEMSKGSEPSQLLHRDRAEVLMTVNVNEGEQNFTTSLFDLTPSGKELAKFIAD